MMSTSAPAFGTYALSGWRAKLLGFAQGLPANWIGRRLALLSRKLVLKNGPDIVDATVENIRFRLYMRDNVSERKYLFLPQFFDAFERAELRRRLTVQSVFVDIGANAGIYTLTAAAAGARVISVEPNPVVLSRLQYNLAANDLLDKVTPVQKGVSDAKGTFDLVLDDTNLGGSSLVATRSDRALQIECDLLQNILQDNGIEKIDAMKIDIEGAEDRALFPFFEAAPESLFPSILIMENSPGQWQRDLPGLLKQKGYRIMQTTRMNVIWEKSGAK